MTKWEYKRKFIEEGTALCKDTIRIDTSNLNYFQAMYKQHALSPFARDIHKAIKSAEKCIEKEKKQIKDYKQQITDLNQIINQVEQGEI